MGPRADLGRIVQRAKLVDAADLSRFEDAIESRTITEEQADSVRQLDLLVRGSRRVGADRVEVILAIEVSVRVERRDDRAIERAAILSSVGYNAEPTVAGSLMAGDLLQEAEARGVHVVLRPDDVQPRFDLVSA